MIAVKKSRIFGAGIFALAVTLTLGLGQGSEKERKKPQSLTFQVGGLRCDHCVKQLTEALKGIKGVEKAEVSLKEKTATVLLKESETAVSELVKQTHKTIPYRLTLVVPIENWSQSDRQKGVAAAKKVKGVREVKAGERGLLITFREAETVRYQDLAESLNRAGLRVAKEPSRADHSSHQNRAEPSSHHSGSGDCCGECADPSGPSGRGDGGCTGC